MNRLMAAPFYRCVSRTLVRQERHRLNQLESKLYWLRPTAAFGEECMPTYEYECTKCGRVTEVFQSITERPRRRFKKSDNAQCQCEAPVKRRIGKGAGIIFKGSGFYETDYRSEGYKKAAKAEKEASDGKTKKDDKEKSTKPAKSDGKDSKPKPTASS